MNFYEIHEVANYIIIILEYIQGQELYKFI